MIDGKLLLVIEIPYELTAYPALAERTLGVVYNPDTKLYRWMFNIKDLSFVQGVLAKPITFNNCANEVAEVVRLCLPIYNKIPASRWKGEGEYSFIERPKIFLCGEWQKDSHGNPKQHWTPIPKESVTAIWNILLRYPLNKKVKVKTISEHLCREKGFTRVFRESGTFDWKKWWGLHRAGYMPYCYWPFKILDHIGVAKYEKIGRICRTKDKMEFQTQFKIQDFSD